MKPSTSIGLDDLSVGTVYACGHHVLTAEEIIRFASDFDPQPFHTDPVVAESTFFRGLAASGWHTAALSMKCLVDGFPLRNGVIGSGGELSWPKPVRPGDTLSVTCEILSITPNRSNPDRAAVRVRIETRNQDGDLVQSFMPKLLVSR